MMVYSKVDNLFILYISYDGLTDPLGQSQILPYLCGLSKKGFKFDLISFEKADKFSLNKSFIEKICREHDITWHPITYTKNPPVLSTVYDIFKMNKMANKLHQQKKFDAVHCRSYIAAITGRQLKLKYQLPFIFDMRGFWVDERVEGKIWNLKNPAFKFIYQYFRKLEKKLFSSSDYIISLTNAAIPAINKIREENKNNISVIPCCVDDSHFDYTKIPHDITIQLKAELGFKNDDFILTYLGSISTWYMPDKMLDFFKVLKSRKANAKFLFITQEDSLYIEELAKSKNIALTDLIFKSANRTELPTLLSISDVTVYFITPSFSKIASSPTKKAELLCMGIPTVCNDGVGDTSKIMEANNSGFVCRNFNTDEYNNAIDFLLNSLNDVNEKSRLRSIGQKEFSLTSGIEKYYVAYQKTLKLN
jgi:glycosyltransferase involved in cell wall biosynthesis